MQKLLIFSDTYMPLITLALFATLWKYVKKQEIVIFIYLAINVLLFGTTNVLLLNKTNNMPLYHIDSLLELWVVAYYILEKITGKKFSSKFWVIGISYTLFFIANVIFWEKWSVFNSNSAGVASLILLFLCMSYLLKLSKSDEILYFQKLPAFWIVSGLLLYNAISVMVVLSYKYFVHLNLHNQSAALWYVLDAGIIIKFALISIGLICHRKQPATRLPFLL